MTLPVPPSTGLVFVNRFNVHGESENFEQIFEKSARSLQAKSGYVWHVLLKCPAEDPFDYMNIACWTDEDSFRAAVSSSDFQSHAGKLRAISTSHPAVCQTVSVGEPVGR